MSVFDLSGASVLVIGSGAMGAATATLAAAQGAAVTLVGADETRLRRAASAGVDARVADLTVAEQAEQVLGDLAPLDHVVVVSGGGPSRASSVVGTDLADAQGAYARLWLSYNVLHAAPARVRAGGSITLVSGSSSRRPVAGLAVWGAVHGAIEALARNAVLEVAPVRVNVVSPGGIGMGTDRQLTDHHGQPRDVAAMVVALMANPAITATVVDVDGGERLGTTGA